MIYLYRLLSLQLLQILNYCFGLLFVLKFDQIIVNRKWRESEEKQTLSWKICILSRPDRTQCIINNANIFSQYQKNTMSYSFLRSQWKSAPLSIESLQNRGNINKTVTHICGVIFLASISLAPVHKMRQGAALFITGLFDCAAQPWNKTNGALKVPESHSANPPTAAALI